MTTLAAKNPTLLDLAKSWDPDGKPARTVELLSQTNEIITDMTMLEGNQTAGHLTTVRTGLPDVIWRKMYQGVPASKSTRAQVTDTCGMLEARSEVDKDLADLNGNASSFRLSEGQAFLEAMNQAFATTMFYGDTSTSPEKFFGLAPRYSAISGAANAQNVIDAGGTGTDNTSIWLCVWGPNTLHGIYPKGMQAGLDHQDLGEIDAFDGDNNRFRAYADLWKWKVGLTLRDWRYVVRIANIDVSNLTTESGAADLIKLLIKAKHRIPSLGMGRPAIYCNRTVRQMLDIQALSKSNSVLRIREAANQFETDFFGIPIRTCDAILETESRVV